jgi:hypothetical protein
MVGIAPQDPTIPSTRLALQAPGSGHVAKIPTVVKWSQRDRPPARIASWLVNRSLRTGRLSGRQPFETHPAQLPVDTPHFTGVGVDINLDISA